MTDSSRRHFLAAAGAGAGAVAVASVGIPAAGAAPSEQVALPPGASGSMAAYIHDLAKGEVLVMVDDREVVVTDANLVARLAHAFAQAEKKA